MERRLSAIFAADMVGYSRLMEADEVGTLQRQKAHRAELINSAFEEFHGRIVKEMGDGVLVEFSSVVEAVQCAVAIQREMTVREADVSDERRIQYRIGINLGDIVIEDDDIFGDGVNISARLEQLAEPGGICISGTTYDQLKSKIEVGYESLGEVQVKNIRQAVRAYKVLIDSDQAGRTVEQKQPRVIVTSRVAAIVTMLVVAMIGMSGWWWVQRPGIEPVDPSKLALNLPDKPSIAVLPFDNLSNDPEQEFFSDGITEDLITDLSQVSGLFVIARNTVFTFKGQAQDIHKIGNKLGVKYVLEGSVRRSGDNLRINAQLIDVQTGGHVWAQRFDRKLADVFELQDEVVQKIVAAMAITLEPVEKERLERVKKAHPEAYIAFLRGLELMRQISQDTRIEAGEYFEKSIEIDPKFTRAYASLAFLLVANVNLHYVDEPAKTIKLALKYAQQALKLDNTVPQIYFALANINHNMNRREDGISAARKAIALDPNYADAYAILAIVLNSDGQYNEALQSIDNAMRLNPETPVSYRWIKGQTHYLLGQLGKAVFWLEDARDSNPEFSNVYEVLIATYAELGKIEEAEWAVSELLTLVPNFSLSQERKRALYRDKKVRRRYLESLRKAGIE